MKPAEPAPRVKVLESDRIALPKRFSDYSVSARADRAASERGQRATQGCEAGQLIATDWRQVGREAVRAHQFGISSRVI